MSAAKKRIIWITCAAVLLLSAAVWGATGGRDVPSSNIPEGITAPAFAVTGEDMRKATFHADVQALSRQLEADTALLYYAPEGVSLETLKNNLGMLRESAAGEDGSVIYHGTQYALSVVPSGGFELQFTGTGDAANRDLSHAEYVSIAEEFLQANGLLCEELTVNTHLYDTKGHEKGAVVVTKAVEFSVSTRLSEAAVTVQVDRAGTVRRVQYDHVHYTKSVEVSLIPVEQAYRFMKQHKRNANGKLLLNLPTSAPGDLTVETVVLAYYETMPTGDTPASLQPVYTFSGTARVGKAHHSFSISVPAVDY